MERIIVYIFLTLSGQAINGGGGLIAYKVLPNNIMCKWPKKAYRDVSSLVYCAMTLNTLLSMILPEHDSRSDHVCTLLVKFVFTIHLRYL